ncbi:hypothetical protein [Streptomyces gibsoniae]|uniref:Uncharacterized protein n=1 Tax=Streptomyces gibsoniae TaxID=3075529 RepID=A0ABU2U2S8_9ACTN|nr:hypothetical protein [Streptomyces sp. DSM 41699]MDT0467473.1 hypothetical protein [Streptomyces sp. DSM 41699]
MIAPEGDDGRRDGTKALERTYLLRPGHRPAQPPAAPGGVLIDRAHLLGFFAELAIVKA